MESSGWPGAESPRANHNGDDFNISGGPGSSFSSDGSLRRRRGRRLP